MTFKFQEALIGDICSVGDGAHSKVKRVDAGIPYLTSKNIGQGNLKLDNLDYISTESFEKLFPKASKATRRPQTGDVLFGIIGTFGNAYLYKEGDYFGFSSSIGVLRPDPEKLCSEYLYYVMSSKSFKDNHANHNSGSVQGYTNIPTIKSLSIPLPSLEEQKRIGRILNSLDNKIDLNTQTNQTLEAIAQAIFKSWFVDFEPVKAKMAALEAGGTSDEAERAAMCAISGKDEAALTQLQTEHPDAYAELAQTAALFPSVMQDSELGEIPVGWSVEQLKTFGQIVCGKTPSKTQPEMFGRDIPFIKIPDMHSSMFVVSPTEHLSEIGAASQIKKMLPRGSLCVSCIATVGKVVITTKESQTNQQINSIIPEFEFYTSYLYFYMLTLEKMFHDLASGGSATLNMNTSTFSGVEIVKPNMELLREFDKRVQIMFREIENGLNQNIELSEIRDTLLPRLLSGETKVSDTGV